MTKPMKSKWISIPAITGICLMSAASFSFAQSDRQQLDEMKQMVEELKKVKLEAQELKEEMLTLRAEMRKLKQESEKQKTNKTLAKSSEKAKVEAEDKQPEVPGKSNPKDNALLPRFAQLPTVTTSPYLGLQSSYDGSDLVVNVSSMAEDLRLLRQRQALAKKMGGDLSVFENRPVIIVSGKLEPTVWGRKSVDNRNRRGDRRSDIDLDSTELDFLVEGSSNVFGFISLAYDNKGFDAPFVNSPSVTASSVNSPFLVNTPVGRRIANSNVYLKRGFITLGNLDKSPLYLSAGQMYTDFGRYTSNMISSTLPSKIGRTNARQIHLGYAVPSGLSASTYVFKGDTHKFNGSKINEGGVNVRYKKDLNKDGAVEIGAGYISNVADSERMQITGLSFPRQGFAFTNEFLFRRVGAFNSYGELKLGAWKFVGEYVGAVRSFDYRNMTMDNEGAQPKAMQLEVSRKFELFNKPSLVGFSYDHSWDALALGLPKDSYGLVFSTYPLKNVRFTLEYRYNNEYRRGSTAFMAGSAFGLVPTALPIAFIAGNPYRSNGGHTNSVIAQLGLYF